MWALICCCRCCFLFFFWCRWHLDIDIMWVWKTFITSLQQKLWVTDFTGYIRISSYSFLMQKNTVQNNPKYGHFSRIVRDANKVRLIEVYWWSYYCRIAWFLIPKNKKAIVDKFSRRENSTMFIHLRLI